MTDTPTGEFYTSDVDLAAYLRCRGLRYERIVPSESNPQIADFVFAECPELFDSLAAWMQDDSLQEFASRRRRMYVMARRAVEGGRR